MHGVLDGYLKPELNYAYWVLKLATKAVMPTALWRWIQHWCLGVNLAGIKHQEQQPQPQILEKRKLQSDGGYSWIYLRIQFYPHFDMWLVCDEGRSTKICWI